MAHVIGVRSKYVAGFALFFITAVSWSQTTTTTAVQGIVNFANGKPATGSIVVTWPAFTTATHLAVATGRLTAAIAGNGSVTLHLTPNSGAIPVGVYYTAAYHLSDGSTREEHWIVPAATSSTLASVLVPATASHAAVAAPAAASTPATVTYLPMTGGTLTGPLQLSADPSSSLQASTKHYVDQQDATELPLAGGVVTGTVAMGNKIEKLPRVDVRSVDFAGGADPTGTRDSLAAIQAAIAFAQASATTSEATYPAIYLPPGHYKVNGTIRLPSVMQLAGDAKGNTILQETGATANLITTYNWGACDVYACYGSIQNLTLEGSGKATTGTLLEMNYGLENLRDLHFYNNGGRGLQMNGPTERVASYNLSFYDIRWPLVMAGDTNEDYFYNTHILEAGETKDASGSPTWFNNWCYSVNCTNGVFHAAGTTQSPTLLYPDPRGAVHIEKAVNVAFIGGSIKSAALLSGVRIWNGSLVKFENFYHEDSYGGNIPRTNRAYILGGKGEQTYFTGALAANSLTVAVHDVSWMPQYFGDLADLNAGAGNSYSYVIMPQDYNRASSAASAYAPGVKQNQYEIVNVLGFASDGNLHIQTGGRNAGGGNAPTGTAWPAGSVIEQYSGYAGFEGSVELSNVHLNSVQGPTAAGGWQVGCDQTNAYACGEILAGYAPDIQIPTSNPATNQIGFYAPYGDPNDQVNGATVYLNMHNMEMFTSSTNPYVGQIATHHQANMQIYGPVSPEGIEGIEAQSATAGGKRISLSPVTGGSFVTAPLYSTGVVANVQVSLPDAGTLWDTTRGSYTKKTAVFSPNQQYGLYMNGLEYQNEYCLFDTPPVNGGRVTNRFCAGGGPSNTGGSGTGYGPGIEYDSWSNTAGWVDLFKIYAQGGVGTMTVGVPATFSSSVAATGPVTGSTYTFGGSANTQSNPRTISNPPVMVWSPWGACGPQYAGCSQSGAPVNLIYPLTLQSWTLTALTPSVGCRTPGTFSLYNGSTTLGTLTLANGTQTYTANITAPIVAAASALQIKVSTAAVGCTTNASGFGSNITYTMQ